MRPEWKTAVEPEEKKELMPLEADETRPPARRSIRRRLLPDGVFEVFDGELIINRRPNERLTVKEIERVLCKANGYITIAARTMKCDPGLIRDYIKRYPRLKRLYDNFLEARLDITERNLDVHCQIGNLEAIKYMLDRRGGERGYSRQLERGPRVVKITLTPAPVGMIGQREPDYINAVEIKDNNGDGSVKASGDTAQGDPDSTGETA
jgi:hypothetical protein